MEKYPRYNGIGDPYPWLRDIARAMDVEFIGKNPPDSTRVNFAILHLDGKAREWGDVKDVDSWDKFGEELVEQFGTKEDEIGVLEELT